MEEGKKIGAYERQLVIDLEEAALARLEDQGMQVVKEIDVEAFRQEILNVYESAQNQELLQRILEQQ